MSAAVTVIPWERDEVPTEKLIRQLLTDEGLSAHRWSNRPRDVYSAHVHEFHKVLYVVQGSITFTLPDDDDAELTLTVGDRLELPPGITHSAVVGPQGVACIEAQRWA
ncbi:MAG: AraC family ligand binding domain-containing protein [Chloroflexota bacterium]